MKNLLVKARPGESLNKPVYGFQSFDVLVVCVLGTRFFEDVCHVMFLLLFYQTTFA